MTEQNVDYVTEKDGVDAASIAAEDAFEDGLALPSPSKKARSRKNKRAGSESDTDFQAESENDSEPEPNAPELINANELDTTQPHGTSTIAKYTPHKQNSAGAFTEFSSKPSELPPTTVTIKGPHPKTPVQLSSIMKDPSSKLARNTTTSRPALSEVVAISSPKSGTNVSPTVKPFKRINIPLRSPLEPTHGSYSNRICPACHKQHPQGACELKTAGVEHCGLCGLAHFGHARTCPHIKSETQVRAMLEALKHSPEKKELVDAAMKYLRGVKGTLVQQKKRDREKAVALNRGTPPTLAAPKPYGPQNNPEKYVSYAPGEATIRAVAQFPTGPPTAYPIVPPQREIPSWYNGPGNGALGRLSNQQSAVEHQKILQTQGQEQAIDKEAEGALRGYLGH
jgi:chromodomain-helicase-DNA-binding protein 4